MLMHGLQRKPKSMGEISPFIRVFLWKSLDINWLYIVFYVDVWLSNTRLYPVNLHQDKVERTQFSQGYARNDEILYELIWGQLKIEHVFMLITIGILVFLPWFKTIFTCQNSKTLSTSKCAKLALRYCVPFAVLSVLVHLPIISIFQTVLMFILFLTKVSKRIFWPW